MALSSPLLVGVYKNGQLLEKIESSQKTSDALPGIFKKLFKQYQIQKIFYARGPGSYMAIKLVYVFLKTLQIVKNIELFGCEGFVFNNNRPIRAFGNLYFVKEDGKIVTKKFEKPLKSSFELPQRLDEVECGEEISPLYVLPAVKV